MTDLAAEDAWIGFVDDTSHNWADSEIERLDAGLVLLRNQTNDEASPCRLGRRNSMLLPPDR